MWKESATRASECTVYPAISKHREPRRTDGDLDDEEDRVDDKQCDDPSLALHRPPTSIEQHKSRILLRTADSPGHNVRIEMLEDYKARRCVLRSAVSPLTLLLSGGGDDHVKLSGGPIRMCSHSWCDRSPPFAIGFHPSARGFIRNVT